jgi:hypothetical protein
MTSSNQPPADTIRYGGLKASIWRNVSQEDPTRVRYSVNYVKGYKNAEGEWKDTSSLSEMDNLKLGVLYSQVAMRIVELKLEDRQSNADIEEEQAA